MSNEEIVELIQQGVDVTANQERLWIQNKAFVRMQIKGIYGINEKESGFDDLMQEGFIGLVTAAMKYDKGRETKFLTCARLYIKQALIRYNQNTGSTIRIPVSMRERIRKYVKYRQQYRDKNNKYPTDAEVMEYLGISEKALKHLQKTIYNMNSVSINQCTSENEEETTLLDKLQSVENIEELIVYSVYNRELKKTLQEALSILDQDTKAVVHSTFYQRNSLEQTAEIFGCSKQAVFERQAKGFYRILHSEYRTKLESFMWEGYHYNEYAYSEFANIENIENEFLI